MKALSRPLNLMSSFEDIEDALLLRANYVKPSLPKELSPHATVKDGIALLISLAEYEHDLQEYTERVERFDKFKISVYLLWREKLKREFAGDYTIEKFELIMRNVFSIHESVNGNIVGSAHHASLRSTFITLINLIEDINPV